MTRQKELSSEKREVNGAPESPPRGDAFAPEAKLKELWQYAVFRWCVYQTPLLVFGLLLKGGALDFYNGTSYQFEGRRWGPVELRGWSFTIWILIFALPAVWVWRKPIWKAIGFLNQKAEEG